MRRLATHKRPIARQSAAVASVAMLMFALEGCPKVEQPETDVSYEPESGRVTVPGATIIQEGTAQEDEAVVPADGLIGIVKDGQAYLYHPALGSADLSVETSRRAVGAFLMEYAQGSSTATAKSHDLRSLPIGNSTVLSTGVTIRRINAQTYEVNNPKRRWVAIKRGEADSPIFVPPRRTYGTLSIADWQEILDADWRTGTTREFTASSTSIETFGAVSRAMLVPVLLPLVIPKAADAIDADVLLFMRLNALDFEQVATDGVFKIVGAVGALTPAPGTGCVDDAARRAFVGVFETGFIRLLTGEDDLATGFAEDLLSDFIQDLADCACDVSVACKPVEAFLDILSAGSWVVDEEVLGNWDVLRNDAYAALTIEEPVPNQAPTANGQTVSVPFDTTRSIMLAASDADNDSLTYEIVQGPNHGGLSGSVSSPTYTPRGGYSGPDNFTFKAFDGQDYSNVATIGITVQPPGAQNVAPTAHGQNVNVRFETATPITLSATDSDNGPQPLSYSIVTQPDHGGLTVAPPSVTYMPDPGFSGADRLTFRAYDGAAQSNVATVSITVQTASPQNQSPVAKDQSMTVPFQTPKTITLMATDSDNGPQTLSYSIVSQPDHGDVTGTPPSVTYAPDVGYSGPDSFTFTAFDGQTYSNVAAVSVTVLPQGTQTSRLNVTLKNSNSQTVPGAIVKRYDTDWGYIDQRTTNGSGMASWDGIPATCYNLEAWYNGEYWVDDTNVCMPAGGTKDLELKRNEPYCKLFKVIRTDTNADVTGGSVSAGTALRLELRVANDSPTSRSVRVQNLRLDRSQSSPYEYEWELGPTSISGGNTYTFTQTVTPSSTGTYYRELEIETNINGTWVKTDGWPYAAAITITSAVGNLNVTVKNSNNQAVSGAIVKRYNTNWGYIDERTTNDSGVASWTGIDATCYSLESWYSGEYWVNDTDVCVPAGGTKNHTLTRNEPYCYAFRVFRTDTNVEVTGGSMPVGTPLRLEVRVTNDSPVSRSVQVQNLRLDRSQSSPYEYEWDLGPTNISGGNSYTFTQTATPSSTGTYYCELEIETSVNGTWAMTDNWPWAVAVTNTAAVGDLNVTVKNSNNQAVSGAIVTRYDTDWVYIDQQTTNGSGVANWCGIDATCYSLEAWYNGEYWVNDTDVCVPAGGTKNHTLTRNEPYTYDFRVTIASNNQDVTGGSVPVGTQLRLRFRLRNSSPATRNVRMAEIKLDRNQQSPWDGYLDHTSPHSVASGGGTWEFTVLWTPSNTGAYYRSFETQSEVNGSWVKTDWWPFGLAVIAY